MDDEEIFASFPRTRTTRKAAATQLRIIDSVLALMGTRGIDKVNVTDVVKDAGVTRSTFYAYFDDVYDVLGYVEEQLVSHLPGPHVDDSLQQGKAIHTPPTAEQCLAPTWYKEWFDYVAYFHNQFRILLGPCGNPQFPHKLRRAIRRAHRKQMCLEGFIDDASQDIMLNALAEFQLRMARDLVNSPTSEEQNFMVQAGVELINTIRVGGWYLRCVDASRRRAIIGQATPCTKGDVAAATCAPMPATARCRARRS